MFVKFLQKPRKFVNDYRSITTAAAIGVSLWASMLAVTSQFKEANPLFGKLGELGATLVVATVIGGLVQYEFKLREERRQMATKEEEERRRKEEARYDFYRNVLADFKSVYDRVENCRLLIHANQSAKTYGEQVRELIGGVVTLHNVKRAMNPGFPVLEAELKEPIRQMSKFLKKLLHEYRKNYKEVSHLQSADESWNEYAREHLPKDGKPPESYVPVARAWARIKEFDMVVLLQDDKDNYKKYRQRFVKWLDQASEAIRKRLPVQELQSDKSSTTTP